jgi:perosamine synthetase
VGSFGDVSVFDFSQPSAAVLRRRRHAGHRRRRAGRRAALPALPQLADRRSVSVGARVPLQAGISELTAALGLAQLARIDEILERGARR